MSRARGFGEKQSKSLPKGSTERLAATVAPAIVRARQNATPRQKEACRRAGKRSASRQDLEIVIELMSAAGLLRNDLTEKQKQKLIDLFQEDQRAYLEWTLPPDDRRKLDIFERELGAALNKIFGGGAA